MKPSASQTNPPTPSRSYRVMMWMMSPAEKLLQITCRDFIQLASEKTDRPLSATETSRYYLHRMMCRICRRQEKRIQQINHRAGESIRKSANDGSVKLAAEARERIRDRVAQEMKHD
jgi:hypothetical protein